MSDEEIAVLSHLRAIKEELSNAYLVLRMARTALAGCQCWCPACSDIAGDLACSKEVAIVGISEALHD
jgi:hypothetical protein